MCPRSKEHLPLAELRSGLDDVRHAPRDAGPVELIVRRPDVDEREELDSARINGADGLEGDNWMAKGSRSTADGAADPTKQITVMNARAVALVAGSRDRWQLAGDQLYVDLDLSAGNVPPGTLLEVGSVVLEVSEAPHRGCAKFAERFGADALRLVNSKEGVELNLRGINARVVQAGEVRTGDKMRRVYAAASESAAAPIRSRKLSQ